MAGPPPGASFFMFKEVPVAGKYACWPQSLIIIYHSIMQKLHSRSLPYLCHNESPFCLMSGDSIHPVVLFVLLFFSFFIGIVADWLLLLFISCSTAEYFHQFCFARIVNILIEDITCIFILTFGCGFEDQGIRSAVWRSGHCTSAYDWRTLSIQIE